MVFETMPHLHFQRKKRSAPEAPAEDQQADPAMFYSSYYGYPYSSYYHILKKREAPAEDQQADPAMFYSTYGYPYSPYTYSGLHILKKRDAEAEEEKKKKVVLINARPYTTLGYPFYNYAPFIYKK